MRYDIDWTEASEDHIARHAVTPSEVEEVFANERCERKGRAATFLALGRTDAGRYLLVVFARSARGGVFIVTARDMTFAERRLFQRQMGA